MKRIIIFFLSIFLIAFIYSAKGQTSDSELKAIMFKSLVKIDTYLTESSNTTYDNMCRIEFHKKAIDSYKTFEKAYNQLKPNLSVEVTDYLKSINNVYSQLAKNENFQYLSDATTATALIMCSVRIDEIMKLLMQ